jgi:heat shock protein HslJ
VNGQRLAAIGAVLAGAVVSGLLAVAMAFSGGASLTGTVWLLTGWTGSTTRFEAGAISVEFADGRYNGFSGVNHYSGPYSSAGGQLRMESPIMTLMAGSPEAMAAESKYFELLDTITGYTVQDSQLVLTGPNQTRLTFRPA